MKTYHHALLDMMTIIETRLDALEAEHCATPPTWLGSPRKRHHFIMERSRELRILIGEIGKLVRKEEKAI